MTWFFWFLMLWKVENCLIFSVFGIFGQKNGSIGKITENTRMPHNVLSFIWHYWESTKVSLISMLRTVLSPPPYITKSLWSRSSFQIGKRNTYNLFHGLWRLLNIVPNKESRREWLNLSRYRHIFPACVFKPLFTLSNVIFKGIW